MKPILMPQVGQDIEVAILLEWKVECGDTVTATDAARGNRGADRRGARRTAFRP